VGGLQTTKVGCLQTTQVGCLQTTQVGGLQTTQVKGQNTQFQQLLHKVRVTDGYSNIQWWTLFMIQAVQVCAQFHQPAHNESQNNLSNLNRKKKPHTHTKTTSQSVNLVGQKKRREVSAHKLHCSFSWKFEMK
jgi:hypothetical protein